MIHSAGNFTKWLHQKAKTLSFETIGYANEKEIPGVNVNVWIDGPYSGTGFLEFTEFQSVLLFCGGSGISRFRISHQYMPYSYNGSIWSINCGIVDWPHYKKQKYEQAYHPCLVSSKCSCLYMV